MVIVIFVGVNFDPIKAVIVTDEGIFPIKVIQIITNTTIVVFVNDLVITIDIAIKIAILVVPVLKIVVRRSLAITIRPIVNAVGPKSTSVKNGRASAAT